MASKLATGSSFEALSLLTRDFKTQYLTEFFLHQDHSWTLIRKVFISYHILLISSTVSCYFVVHSFIHTNFVSSLTCRRVVIQVQLHSVSTRGTTTCPCSNSLVEQATSCQAYFHFRFQVKKMMEVYQNKIGMNTPQNNNSQLMISIIYDS